MFSKRIRSVVPMHTADLAADDGSMMSAGRGSGLDKKVEAPRVPKLVPYTQMAFAPLERRLDVAIFRSLFASSARQARQFVIHGAVTVNGQKVRRPRMIASRVYVFPLVTDFISLLDETPKLPPQPWRSLPSGPRPCHVRNRCTQDQV